MSDVLILNADGQPLGLLPIQARSWQKVIPDVFINRVQVLHTYEDWVVRSPSITVEVPAVVVLNQYSRPKHGFRFTPTLLKLRDDHTCRYCGEVFAKNKLTMDHVVPESHGGKVNWDNIVAACQPCNGRRGNNTRIRPSHAPYRPSYWELVAKMKTQPITVGHASWLFYLDWPEELVRIRQR